MTPCHQVGRLHVMRRDLPSFYYASACIQVHLFSLRVWCYLHIVIVNKLTHKTVCSAFEPTHKHILTHSSADSLILANGWKADHFRLVQPFSDDYWVYYRVLWVTLPRWWPSAIPFLTFAIVCLRCDWRTSAAFESELFLFMSHFMNFRLNLNVILDWHRRRRRLWIARVKSIHDVNWLILNAMFGFRRMIRVSRNW